MAPHVPRRRCVGCGRIAPKHELVRIAIAPGVPAPLAVLDEAARMPGRGAYLCRSPVGRQPSRACLEQAIRRGGIRRTLRAPVTLDPKIVESTGR